MQKIFSFTVALLLSAVMSAEELPVLKIYFTTEATGEEQKTAYEGSAPIVATFHYDLTLPSGWSVTKKEWHFAHQGGSLDDPYMIKDIDEPVITFRDAGTDSIALYLVVSKPGTSDIEFQRDYWSRDEPPLTIKPSESDLTFPNAFSPNGDGKNDFYKPKTHQSIVEFRAIIFNRWGQKIYEWDNVDGDGWDGTFKGKDVKQGVYFALIKAKGADGTVYELKKDVNLLRSYNDEAEGNYSSQDGL